MSEIQKNLTGCHVFVWFEHAQCKTGRYQTSCLDCIILDKCGRFGAFCFNVCSSRSTSSPKIEHIYIYFVSQINPKEAVKFSDFPLSKKTVKGIWYYHYHNFMLMLYFNLWLRPITATWTSMCYHFHRPVRGSVSAAHGDPETDHRLCSAGKRCLGCCKDRLGENSCVPHSCKWNLLNDRKRLLLYFCHTTCIACWFLFFLNSARCWSACTVTSGQPWTVSVLL